MRDGNWRQVLKDGTTGCFYSPLMDLNNSKYCESLICLRECNEIHASKQRLHWTHGHRSLCYFLQDVVYAAVFLFFRFEYESQCKSDLTHVGICRDLTISISLLKGWCCGVKCWQHLMRRGRCFIVWISLCVVNILYSVWCFVHGSPRRRTPRATRGGPHHRQFCAASEQKQNVAYGI